MLLLLSIKRYLFCLNLSIASTNCLGHRSSSVWVSATQNKETLDEGGEKRKRFLWTTLATWRFWRPTLFSLQF